MNEVQSRKWDIIDVYESDLYGGNPDQDVMYIVTYLGDGEIVEICEFNYSEISEELHEELKQVEGYNGTERIFIAKVSCTGEEGNMRINASKYWKENEFGDGFFGMLVLEDSNPAGRKRKKKRTSNAVTNIKPNQRRIQL